MDEGVECLCRFRRSHQDLVFFVGQRVLGGPGIHRAVPREPRHWCPAPFSERRCGRHDRRGSFHPLLDLSVSCVADSIDSPCLSESQPARTYLLEGLGCNIASCWHGFSLGSICFLWMFSFFPICLIGCFHPLPRAVAALSQSAAFARRFSGGVAPEPLPGSGASMGVFSLFAPEPWMGMFDVAHFSARRCSYWGPPRALGGLRGGVLTFCAFFLWYIGCRQQREIRKRGWVLGLGGFLVRVEAPSGMALPR